MKMKFLNTITTCVLLSLMLVACGDDEADEKMGLNGDWEAQSINFDVSTSLDAGGMTTTTRSVGEGENLDYSLNLNNGEFKTSGSYDFSITTTSTIITEPTTDTQTYSNVMGSGTYTNTDTEITADGQFFDFDFNGMSLSSSTGPVTASYTLDGDLLTFEQNDTTMLGVTAAIIQSTSVWKRK